MQFQVQIPLVQNPQEQETLTVEAPNWLVALRDGLKKLGDKTEMRNISCDIFGANDVRVTETKSGRTFEVREMRDGVVASPAPAVAAPKPASAPVSSNRTEAFVPPQDFFDNMKTTNTEAQQQPVAMSNVPSTPPAVVPTPAPVSKPAPVPVAPPAPSSDQLLGQEDLSFNQPVPVVDGKKSGAPVALASPAPAVASSKPSVIEQRAVPQSAAPAPKPAPPAPKPAPPAPKPAPVQAAPVAAKPAPAPAKPAFDTNPSGSGISIGFSGSDGKYSPGMTTEIIADVFMRAMEIYDYGEDRHAAMKFTLDLATDHVSATGGAVLLTDINSPNQELWFEVAHGPKSKQMVNFRIPMGRGIVGFCAQEGVNLLIPSAVDDARFENDILKDVGLSPGSMLCAPIQHNKRMLGAIMLYNQPDERPFTQGELSIVNYLAHTAGEYLINLI